MRFNKYLLGLLWGASLMACQPKVPTPALCTIDEDALELRPQEGRFYYRDALFTGIAIKTVEDHRLAQTAYVNGKKHGLHQQWFPNGQKSYESPYDEGKIHGIARSWWRNGQLRRLSRYEQGVPHGTQEQWYASGQLFKRQHLDYGQEKGLQQAWRKNGALYNNYEAKNGRIFGLKRANLCYQLDDETVQYD